MPLMVHFEIHGTEPEQLAEFYTELFGWSFTKFGDIDYWVIDTGEGQVQMDAPGYGIGGGLARRRTARPDIGAPVNGGTMVIGVENVDEVFARALGLGAKEALPLETIPSVGRTAYLLDPDNNVFGIITPEMP